jgi:CheY-like chemotaxis protein
VDDNEEVAAISAAFFEQLGYEVKVALNGSQALQKLQAQDPYDLVFTDILMPGSVAGLELARIVREHHPDVLILLTTGYSEKAQEAIEEGFVVLQKPYDLRSLSKAIRELRKKFKGPASGAAEYVYAIGSLRSSGLPFANSLNVQSNIARIASRSQRWPDACSKRSTRRSIAMRRSS